MMNLRGYEFLEMSEDGYEYRFKSVGQKDCVEMVIQFAPGTNAGIWVVAFGKVLPDGRLDDESIIGNGDRDKILATVIAAIDNFLTTYPEKSVFFTGSTPGRTRLYRIILSTNALQLKTRFKIFGVKIEVDGVIAEPFTGKGEYFGFLIESKVR